MALKLWLSHNIPAPALLSRFHPVITVRDPALLLKKA
jgi:hypothetical protein